LRWKTGKGKHWGDTNAYNNLNGKPEGQKQFGRRKRKWDTIIKKDLECTDWIQIV
jgi:hypothetical protein